MVVFDLWRCPPYGRSLKNQPRPFFLSFIIIMLHHCKLCQAFKAVNNPPREEEKEIR
jgi:hypothetical protein